MEQIVAEREAHGDFASLDDAFRRMPPGAMNRRQLESLAGAGAFDSLEPAGRKCSPMPTSCWRSPRRRRASGRAARRRCSVGRMRLATTRSPPSALAEAEPWTRAEQMAAERENFGFYFAAHPVESYRAVASANGARPYASLMEAGATGGRQPAVLAALVEGVSKGRTRKGAPFIRGDFSDSSGQFSAACFEDSLVDSFQRWAAEGTCVLLQVELDSPSPEEPPRVTVRGARPLAEVTSAARMVLTLDVNTLEAVAELRLALRDGEPGSGRGEVLARVDIGEGRAQT